MEYNVSHISAEYDFTVSSVSYIGNPKPHTAMFVTRKAEKLLTHLEGVSSCLVFAENGLSIASSLQKYNCFVFSDNPQSDYARFANILYKARIEAEKHRKYTQHNGSYIGENVQLGENAYIEPGCLIGHDVIIGSNACILSGTVIKKSVIGNDFTANECAVIGASGFTITKDEYGNNYRIPTLGKVMIGSHVEIGSHNNISCGSGGDTIIEDYVKLATLVGIEHDVYLGKNVEITAGCIVGGFSHLEAQVYVGINSAIRNRISLKENCTVGMGSTVTKSVASGITVVGNPARPFDKED